MKALQGSPEFSRRVKVIEDHELEHAKIEVPEFVDDDEDIDHLVDDDVVRDLKGTAILGDPIVGTEIITYDERGPGALAASPLPSPKRTYASSP